MAEATINVKNKRRIWVAIMFSLIMPGLGQVYCGKLTRGLVLNFLNILPLPIITGLFLVSNSPSLMLITVGLIAVGGIVQLIAIVDSAYLAKHTKEGYELKDYNRWYVYVLFVLIITAGSIGSALYLREQTIEAFRVPAASCYPTIVPNDRILANKSAYKTNEPRCGDIVVFISPENRHGNWIKRIIAVAGDTVEIKSGDLYVNGQKLERTSIGRTILRKGKKKIEGEVFLEKHDQIEYRIFLADQKHKATDFAQITIPEHHCFVLGDNRTGSRDSRHFGPINLALIKARADYIYWPAKGWSRFGRIN